MLTTEISLNLLKNIKNVLFLLDTPSRPSNRNIQFIDHS